MAGRRCLNHLPVARLENVQRHIGAWKEHQIREREQWDDLRDGDGIESTSRARRGADQHGSTIAECRGPCQFYDSRWSVTFLIRTVVTPQRAEIPERHGFWRLKPQARA